MAKNLLAVSCAATLVATGYLSLSLLVLSSPRANFTVWFELAAVLGAQSLATIIAINLPRPPAALRYAVASGALLLLLIATWRVRATLTGAHFEGYNLLLGAILVVQGVLTFRVVRLFRSFPPPLPQSR
jgi:hypothetical protein